VKLKDDIAERIKRKGINISFVKASDKQKYKS